MTVFLRIVEPPVDDKSEVLLRAVAVLRDSGKRDESFQRTLFERDPEAFAAVPGSPFAYWVSEALLATFRNHPSMQRNDRRACAGAVTNDNARFVRVHWELDGGPGWPAFAKGGAFSRYYADIYLRLRWLNDGHELKTFVSEFRASHGWSAHWAAELHNATHYFRPGLTWPLRTTSGFGIRAMPASCIFGHKGPGAFVDGDSPDHLLALSALLNSRSFGYLISVQLAAADAAARSYEVGVVQQTPVPDLSDENSTSLAHFARRAWSLKRTLDTTNETSHAFLLPPGLNEKMTGLDREAVEREVESIQKEIDEVAFRLYGIGAEDRAAIEASSKRTVTSDCAAENSSDEDDDAGEDEASVGAAADTLLSWLVGVAFGRFDPRLATGARAIPPEPEPFDPLPSRSPGMWPEGEESQVFPPDILVGDSGHTDDICAHVANAAAKTGVPDLHDLRPWLMREFFPLHIKMYSKSRRKAPIYWQLATPSASYSVWLYIHAFTKDTLFRVQNDYAAPKLAHEERRLEALAGELRDKSTTAQRKELAAQQTIVEELRAFLEEVKRVTPLWNPNLDDGVIINFAPLWRLVPQHKPWQKELKSTWDALLNGKYDWAHLAMHLWPERVVPKCATDRSLAIAHGLEDVFWVEGTNGKWTARKTPTRSVDELVRERTSPAVKAALESLLAAPTATGSSRKRGGQRRSAAATNGAKP